MLHRICIPPSQIYELQLHELVYLHGTEVKWVHNDLKRNELMRKEVDSNNPYAKEWEDASESRKV